MRLSILKLSVVAVTSLANFGASAVLASAEPSPFLRKSTLLIQSLVKLSKICNDSEGCYTIQAYHPWDRVFLLVNRDNRKEFIGINLQCPTTWECRPERYVDGDIRTIHGFASTEFALPANGNFEFANRANQAAEPPIAQLMEASNSKFFFLSYVPMDLPGIASSSFKTWFDRDWYSIYYFLHEAFHAYGQFSQDGTFTPWKNEDKLFPKASRTNTPQCRPSSSPEIRAEDDVLRKISVSLLEGLNIPETTKTVSLLRSAKEYRYSKIPTALRANDKVTDCRILDTLYERSEGMAEYAGMTSVVRLGLVSRQEIARYFDENYFLAGNDRQTDYGYYAAGLNSAFLLERLDPKGGWQKQIFSSPNKTFLDLLEETLATR